MPAVMEMTGYIPIDIARLVPTEANAGFDLYCRDPSTLKPVLYRAASLPLHPSDIRSLRKRGVTNLYMTQAARDQYRAYLYSVVGLRHPKLEAPLATRVSALVEVARDILEPTLGLGDTDQVVADAQRLGNAAAEIICADDFRETELFRAVHHDHELHTHSANVAFYAGILAKQLGYGDDDVRRIITGGLLHDLGKLDIDTRILEKPDRLDQSESRELQRHPAIGMSKLALRPELTLGQLMMVYQHHERIDGSGYPVGSIGKEIHAWAKLCGVIDAFEALTSYRHHRKPKPKNFTLDLLQRESGKTFDPEILACWVSITRTSWQS